jgi:hypothetical protein
MFLLQANQVIDSAGNVLNGNNGTLIIVLLAVLILAVLGVITFLVLRGKGLKDVLGGSGATPAPAPQTNIVIQQQPDAAASSGTHGSSVDSAMEQTISMSARSF